MRQLEGLTFGGLLPNTDHVTQFATIIGARVG
jgi:hypothetical protein